MANFGLFYPFILVCSVMTVTFDFIDKDRFKREQRLRESFISENDQNDGSESVTPRQSVSRAELAWQVGVAAGKEEKWSGVRFKHLVRFMPLYSSYHKMAWIHIIFIIINVTLLLHFLMKSTVFGVLSTDSHLYVWIKEFYRIVYCLDDFAIYDHRVGYHQLRAMLMVQSLIRRCRCIWMRFHVAVVNEHEYRSLNITSLNMAYLHYLNNFSLKEWWIVLRDGLRHKCCDELDYRGPTGKRLLHAEKKMANSSRVERLFAYNSIDFDECYQTLEADGRHESQLSECMQTVSAYFKQTIRLKQAYGVKSRPYQFFSITWALICKMGKFCSRMYRRVFSISLIDRSWYLPEPKHRMDLGDMSTLLVVHVISITGFAILNTSVVWARYIGEHYYERIGREMVVRSNDATQWTSVFRLERFLFNFDVTLSEMVLGINNTDILWFFLCTLIHYSRTMRIVRILNAELLRDSRIRKTRYTSQEHMHAKERGKNSITPTYHSLFSRDRSRVSEVLFETRQIDNRRSTLEDLLAKYEGDEHQANDISSYSVKNTNVGHILDMCTNVINELQDLKSELTFQLNVSALFSIVTTAYSVTLMLTCYSTIELFYLLPSFLLSVIPFFVCLIQGALIENSTMMVYRNLNTLSLNEFQIINEKNLKRMGLISDYLKLKENRSYMLIGRTALTPATIVPVIGWIFTGVVLLQRLLI